MAFQRKWPRNKLLRRAIAAVEFAVILPPVVMLLMVSIEVARAFTVQHALQEASMNGCRIYSLDDMTQQDAIDMANLSLDEAGIEGYTIEFAPETKEEILADLDPVTVTVSVPYNQVGLGIQWFLGNSTLSAAVTLPAVAPRQNP
ncbi:TadE-like protein [Planctomycetes bacterium CA13]|uniref:TadE-like protein n=1 Tax=Novipirellula herctigrandis TaxID=2527986 RepID=A0A5C5Z7C2_9BACT|nr:TadE-like protein [Planctomycetes bacterium CA13]